MGQGGDTVGVRFYEVAVEQDVGWHSLYWTTHVEDARDAAMVEQAISPRRAVRITRETEKGEPELVAMFPALDFGSDAA
jgi:hypothetical protein